LKPLEAARGNKVLLCDVTNRGNKLTYLPLNFPFKAPPEFPPLNDLSTAEDAGTGYLMRQGYTLGWTGWDATAPAGNDRLTMTVPDAIILQDRAEVAVTEPLRTSIEVEVRPQ
jgi:hypothetical protein